MVRTGRHFLQIPGPTNVPDRVLRAMDMPTIDHRGPEFAQLGSRRDLPLVGDGGLGSGNRQHTLPRRQGVDGRDWTFRNALERARRKIQA